MQFPFPFFDILTIPFGAFTGIRIEIDGTTGEIRFYDSADNLVGFLSSAVWYVGSSEGARIQLDPLGGFRVFRDDGMLVGIFDKNGIQVRDPDAGIICFDVHHDGMVRIAAPNGNAIEFNANVDGTKAEPKWSGLFALSPGTTHVTPAIVPFGSTDFELRYVAAFTKAVLAAQTMSPAAGYTEQLDTFDANNGSSMLVSLGSKQPQTSNAQRTFTSTSSAWEHDACMTVVYQSDAVTPPSIRDMADSFQAFSGTNEVELTITAPTIVAGDVLTVFVAMENDGGSVPISWETPEGFNLLGAGFQFTGSGSTQSTGAAGCWRKIATADDAAASSYSVAVQMAGAAASTKKFHVLMVAVKDVKVLTGGADIRFEPASRCRVWRSGNYNFPDLNAHVLPLNTASFDPGDNFDLVTNNEYIVPQSGPYVVGWRVQTTGAAAGERFLSRLLKNSAVVSAGGDVTNAAGAVVLQGADDLDLVEGDSIQVQVQQVNGVLRAVSGANDATTFFFIQRTLST